MTTNDLIIYRLMNHDSLGEAKFDKYTLAELNNEFGTEYSSIDEAIDSEPEYLFSEKDVQDWFDAGKI